MGRFVDARRRIDLNQQLGIGQGCPPQTPPGFSWGEASRLIRNGGCHRPFDSAPARQTGIWACRNATATNGLYPVLEDDRGFLKEVEIGGGHIYDFVPAYLWDWCRQIWSRQ